MKKWLTFLYSFWTLSIFAQKPALDSNAYDKWQSLNSPTISNNGRYCSYIRQETSGSTLIIQATYGSWKMEIKNGAGSRFMQDSRFAIVMQEPDSLLVITLGASEPKRIPGIKSFDVPRSGMGEWLACQLNNGNNDLVLYNLRTGQQINFPHIKSYLFNEKGTALVIQMNLEKNRGVALTWVDLSTGSVDTVWMGNSADNFTFGGGDGQLAFIGTEREDTLPKPSIFLFQPGTAAASKLVDGNSALLQYGFLPNGIISFNKGENKLFVTMKGKIHLPQNITHPVDVDIYSYLDAKLQSQQLKDLEYQSAPVFHFVVDVPHHHLIRLEEDGEVIISPLYPQLLNVHPQDYVLVRKSGGGDLTNEWRWNMTSRCSISLVSTATGMHKLLFDRKSVYFTINCALSAEGKYVIYYDPDSSNYFSYSTTTGATRNITKGVHATWTSYDDDMPKSIFSAIGLAGWTSSDSSVWIYDRHDIWQADPKGLSPPFSLTQGYGRIYNLIFHLALRNDDGLIEVGKMLLLSAFSRANKDNGFYTIEPGKKGNPRLLTMQPYELEGTEYDLTDFPPIKAQDTSIYLVRRESAEESPNYFVSSDLREFHPLTHIHPEQEYNWLRAELITWRLPDRTSSQGILYKPENFDPKKKYPLIFYYYEKLSGGLHTYPAPAYSFGVLNIPQYVSNGYLVFTPDIHYTIGHPGQSVLNTLVSAANYLSQLPYVDRKHMGIQGHSRGGWETNFLVTHTQLFAAAMSASGFADYISLYGGIRRLNDGSARNGAFESGPQRIGASLWERPDLYIENSPIFTADKITTPLLMMGNEKDRDVPFDQGIEFFIALRRLGKKVWMLQYDGSGHSLSLPGAQKDLTIRMQQFFDHYLKGTPAPRWMVEGIPANRKGLDLGYGLEPPGVEPGPGLASPIPK